MRSSGVTSGQNAREVLAIAKRLGCVVGNGKGSELKVSHPGIPWVVCVDVKRKDATRQLTKLVRRAESLERAKVHETPEPKMETPTMGSKVSDKHKQRKLKLKNEILRAQARAAITTADLSELLGVRASAIRAWEDDPTRMPRQRIEQLEEWVQMIERLSDEVDAPEPGPEPLTDKPEPTDLPVTMAGGGEGFAMIVEIGSKIVMLDLKRLSDDAVVELLTACNAEVLRRRTAL